LCCAGKQKSFFLFKCNLNIIISGFRVLQVKPKQTAGFVIHYVNQNNSIFLLAFGHHKTWTLIFKINLSREDTLWSNTLLFLSFQMDQTVANQIVSWHNLISLRNMWAPQNWWTKEITFGKVQYTPSQLIISPPNRPKKAQFNNRWWK
jgi:hypothetical protein